MKYDSKKNMPNRYATFWFVCNIMERHKKSKLQSYIYKLYSKFIRSYLFYLLYIIYLYNFGLGTEKPSDKVKCIFWEDD